MKTAQRLAIATALLTLVLIAIGAYVRASGSGLGCPDWPTCHGGAVPIDHHSSIEMSHRYTATLVGFMVIGTAVMAWRFYRHVPVVCWTAIALVPLVGLQGLLGAVTVIKELPPEIVATHLLTAMIVLSLELVVAIGMWREDPERTGTVARARSPLSLPVGRLAVAATAWLAVTLWIGGYMAESGATTACDGWPLCNGSVLPAADDQEITHMVHRYLAGALVVFVVPLAVMAWRRRHDLPWAGPLGVALAAFYALQVTVGAFNIWFDFPDVLTVSHTAIASLVWFTLSAVIVFSYYQPAAVRRPAAGSRIEVPA